MQNGVLRADLDPRHGSTKEKKSKLMCKYEIRAKISASHFSRAPVARSALKNDKDLRIRHEPTHSFCAGNLRTAWVFAE